ncbi:hypothetical protein PIB30_093532 [Stylosanthes scabra]|uniref:Uncharacterized protein n=1 Tax=Stylosanthes scabra TaxID=79078 RepID=A0ABU6RVH5_9FABA|nr:hypothetical protein [Stylosanthes scabra]
MQASNRTMHNNLTDSTQLQQQQNVNDRTRRSDYLTSQGRSHQPLTAGTGPTRYPRSTSPPQMGPSTLCNQAAEPSNSRASAPRTLPVAAASKNHRNNTTNGVSR